MSLVYLASEWERLLLLTFTLRIVQFTCLAAWVSMSQFTVERKINVTSLFCTPLIPWQINFNLSWLVSRRGGSQRYTAAQRVTHVMLLLWRWRWLTQNCVTRHSNWKLDQSLEQSSAPPPCGVWPAAASQRVRDGWAAVKTYNTV